MSLGPSRTNGATVAVRPAANGGDRLSIEPGHLWEALPEALKDAIRAHRDELKAMAREAVERVVLHTERDEHAERQAALGRELRDLDKRITRFVELVETSADVTSIVAKLRDLEARRAAVRVEMDALRPLPRLAPGVVDDCLGEWRRILRESTTKGRLVLERVLNGRITFTPRANGSGYDFDAPTRFDRLFSGVATPMPEAMARWIAEHDGLADAEVVPREETWDPDYAALLERAQRRYAQKTAGTTRVSCADANRGKGRASPAGTDPGWNIGFRREFGT